MSNIHLHCVATHVQDLGTVVHALLIGLTIWSQTQQVWVERHSYRMQRPFVNLRCQMTLLHQAGFVSLEPPEMAHLHYLQQRAEVRGFILLNSDIESKNAKRK